MESISFIIIQEVIFEDLSIDHILELNLNLSK